MKCIILYNNDYTTTDHNILISSHYNKNSISIYYININ